MYSEDVPKIKEYVKTKGPEGFQDVIIFVLLTIRTPFSRVRESVKSVSDLGKDSPQLWGFKRKGYLYSKQNKERLYRSLVLDECTTLRAVEMLLDVPGLGLAKASFVAQCLGYDTACLDTHNLKILGLSSKVLTIKKDKKKSIEDYLTIVQKEGPEFYWNTWCDYLTTTSKNKGFKDGREVSRHHVECITKRFG